MKITLEAEWETYTTEFKNVDVTMEQVINAFKGMLLSYGFSIETINEYFKQEEDYDNNI